MSNYQIKYLKYKKKYDKLKNKLISKINSEPEYKLLYNTFVNNYLSNNNYNDTKTIFIENITDLVAIIGELNIDDIGSKLNLNTRNMNTKLDPIKEEDDL